MIGNKCAHCWAILIENILNRVFPNWDGIILLHGALVRSNSDGLKSRKLRCSWFSGLLQTSPTFRNPYLFSTLGLRKYFKQIKNKWIFGKYYFGKSRNFKDRHLRKRRVPENPWDPSDEISKILNMISISFKKMKWTSWNFEFNERNPSHPPHAGYSPKASEWAIPTLVILQT